MEKKLEDIFLELINNYTEAWKKEGGYNTGTRFNIFESISDLYYRENFHSDILATILDPNTQTIGNILFIKEFLKTINLTEKDFEVNENIIVQKEVAINECGDIGRIDILITNGKQALIIENKINNAPDMPNQLVRYMKYVEEILKIKKYKVIYLTLAPGKKPPIDLYNKEYDYYKKKLKTNLIYLSAVDKSKENNKKNLVNSFLKNSISSLEINENKNILLSKVYLEQYKQLLENLGKEYFMEDTKSKIIEEVYNDEGTIEGFFNLVNLFNNTSSSRRERTKLLGEIVCHYLVTNKLLKGYKKEQEDPIYFYKKIDEYVSIYLFVDFTCGEASFGYGYYTKELQRTENNKLKKILEDKEQIYLVNSESPYINNLEKGTWIASDFDICAVEEDLITIPKFAKIINEKLKCLENKYKELKKNI